ncbi:MAG: alpha/beta hydrolase, partial [Planctomycetia bacterium]|nr:alpha/beta hydrolase [Planctomycetia bacterium]
VFDDPEVWNTDFTTSVTRVEIPVFFFSGVHDHDTPHELLAAYYPQISAPRKRLYRFERSAHFPFYEEPDLFNRRLIGLKDPWTDGTG